MSTVVKVLLAMLFTVLLVLTTGCALRMTPEQIEQIAAAQEACNEAGGTFEQWQGGLSGEEMWRCDFDQREDRP